MNAIDLAVQKGADNRNAVWNFFRDNPCHTQSECSKRLGMSAKTVGAHCKAIRGGWRPVNMDDPCERIIRAVSYPVCSSIDPLGFGLRSGSDDLIALVHDIARGARHPISGCSPAFAPSLISFDNVGDNDLLSSLEYFKTADVDPQVLGHYKSEAFRRGLIS